MTQRNVKEAAFETAIEIKLLEHGYISIPGHVFDRERAIFPNAVLDFIRETQPQSWAKLQALHGERTGDQILDDLCKWMEIHGSLATLRHGFKCYGRTLQAAYFKAAHDLNPELAARYTANRLGITRQLRFSPKSGISLDVTLSVNGIPVVTLELKNPLTGQRAEDARRQYQHDRDPREPIFEFKRRTLVHFAVDTESVLMTTRLAGTATHFLPFDKGHEGAAGNPPDPEGRTYRTAFLWEDVLERDSKLLDILARFMHLQIDEKRDDAGRKVRTETMIFPRYHQLEAVRTLVQSARDEGAGHNYLVEHSAGSGKSNTIAWLTHRLASLHDAQSERIFDSVVVVTDRIVLDQQLQDTIYQFEHKRGVVQQIDKGLAAACESVGRRRASDCDHASRSSRLFPGICSTWRRNAARRARVDWPLDDVRLSLTKPTVLKAERPPPISRRCWEAKNCESKRERERKRKASRTWRSCSEAWPSAASRRISASSHSRPRPSTRPSPSSPETASPRTATPCGRR